MSPIDLAFVVKFAVALAASGLLGWGAWLARVGRGDLYSRERAIALAALGLVGALCWTNFFQYHFTHYLHASDFYHYFMGGKYLPELGYDGLYECAAVADLEAGRAQEVRERGLRDLRSNRLVPGDDVLAHPERCTDRFEPDRWAEYKSDIEWFRRVLSPSAWDKLYQDYGFNGTPAWSILGTPLANLHHLGVNTVLMLTALDWILIALMWLAVWWAFGWRALAAAVVFWGTNYPAHFGWTGGSYLRQDWLAALVIGLCCLRRGWFGTAGFALAWGACLRIYPGLALFALALRAAIEVARRRSLRIDPGLTRLGVGAALGFAVLIPLGGLTAGGLDAWPAFVENIALHSKTPGVNRVGLETVVSYDRPTSLGSTVDLPGSERAELWQSGRQRTFEQRRWLYWLGVVGFVAMLGFAVRGEAESWVVGVLGIGLIPVLADPTSYYLGAFLVFGLLLERDARVPAGLCLFSALSIVTLKVTTWPDARFLGLSLLLLPFITYVYLSLGLRRTDGAAHQQAATR